MCRQLGPYILVTSPEMTCKTGQMSVHASVRCQHFQNHIRLQDHWADFLKLASHITIFYGSAVKTSSKWNFEYFFGPCATQDR